MIQMYWLNIKAGFMCAKVANKNVTTKFSSSESREKLDFTMLSREIILTKVEF
jgi:hypothetical protein